jgi:hypothetical protein
MILNTEYRFDLHLYSFISSLFEGDIKRANGLTLNSTVSDIKQLKYKNYTSAAITDFYVLLFIFALCILHLTARVKSIRLGAITTSATTISL